MARLLNGQCFCRTVRYTVADAFAYAVNCHCGNCRRATGAAFKPIAGIAREHLTIVAGEADMMRWASPCGTWSSEHCRHCGSLLYALIRQDTFAHVAMGTLIDAPSIRPTAHAFVGSKAPWYTITDDLPQYEGPLP
jgi:hypothetical protein